MSTLIHNKSELFIGLLYQIYEIDPNLYLYGSTKLQKCIFFLQKLLEIPKDIQYNFKAGKFGPFSPKLRADVEFESMTTTVKIIEKEKLNFYDEENITITNRFDYRLTGKNLDLFRSIFESYPSEKKLIFYAVRNLTFFDSELIIGLIYYLYPELTINSKILHKIRRIPLKLIRKTAISFFKSIPYKLVKKIYKSNKNFNEIIPDINEITSYNIKKLDKKEEEKILTEIIKENPELLKTLAKY